jgi:hypothetical protein
MLTAITEEDWTIVLPVFAASRSRRGDKDRDDRTFLEALHNFVDAGHRGKVACVWCRRRPTRNGSQGVQTAEKAASARLSPARAFPRRRVLSRVTRICSRFSVERADQRASE